MLGKSPHQAQTELFKNLLAHQLNTHHPLCQLAHARLGETVAPLYACAGLPRSPHQKNGWPPALSVCGTPALPILNGMLTHSSCAKQAK